MMAHPRIEQAVGEIHQEVDRHEHRGHHQDVGKDDRIIEPVERLQSVDGVQNYMKLTVALEVANESMMTEIQPRLAKVVDAFQVYMRELRKSDLEGSAGVYRLKEELLRRVNLAVYPARIESILFKEILVQ